MNKCEIVFISLLHFDKDFRFLLILIKVSKLIDKKSFMNVHCVMIKRIIFCSKFQFFLFNRLLIFSLLSHDFEFLVDFFLLFLEIFLLRTLINWFYLNGFVWSDFFWILLTIWDCYFYRFTMLTNEGWLDEMNFTILYQLNYLVNLFGLIIKFIFEISEEGIA